MPYLIINLIVVESRVHGPDNYPVCMQEASHGDNGVDPKKLVAQSSNDGLSK